MSGLAATVGLLLCGAASASAADITASPECCTFTAGPFSQAQGETANFLNLDEGGATSFHNVTAQGLGPDGDPLFSSETILGAGATTPVEGTEYLPAGSYPFVCSLHASMTGNLEVTGDGTPVARPGVKLSVTAQKLKQVRKSGKLKVKVTPIAPATDVTLEVKKGSKLIGKVEGLSVTTGAKTVPVKLTKSGLKAIKKGKKISFAVSAQVPWGKPAKTNRALR